MNDEPDDDTLEQTRLLRELTMRPKEVLALRILELTRICNVETGKVAALRAENEALAAELKKGTDTLTLATKTMEHYREALDALRTENERQKASLSTAPHTVSVLENQLRLYKESLDTLTKERDAAEERLNIAVAFLNDYHELMPSVHVANFIAQLCQQRAGKKSSAEVKPKHWRYVQGYKAADRQIKLGKNVSELIRQAESDIDQDTFNRGWLDACEEHSKKGTT